MVVTSMSARKQESGSKIPNKTGRSQGNSVLLHEERQIPSLRKDEQGGALSSSASEHLLVFWKDSGQYGKMAHWLTSFSCS
jgi:hypothetical protein